MSINNKATKYALHTGTFEEAVLRLEDVIFVMEEGAFIKGAEYISQSVFAKFQGDESARAVLDYISTLLHENNGN